MTNYRHVLSNKMLSALHATDVIYMLVYLSAAAQVHLALSVLTHHLTPSLALKVCRLHLTVFCPS